MSNIKYDNEYDDYLITFGGTGEIPKSFDPTNKKIIYKNFTSCPPKAVFLYDSIKYGKLYCSEEMKNIHPYMKINENNKKIDQLNGACCVVFIMNKHNLFCVLVKTSRKHLTNPAGYSNWNEKPKDTAIREILEETNLVITNPIQTIQHVDKHIFGQLEWTRSVTFVHYAFAECPDSWLLNDNVNNINFTDENDEIEYIMVINTKILHSAKNVRTIKKLYGIDIRKRDYNYIMDALSKINYRNTY